MFFVCVRSSCWVLHDDVHRINSSLLVLCSFIQGVIVVCYCTSIKIAHLQMIIHDDTY